jgi:hypothetical protein
MAYVQVPPDGAGKKVYSKTHTVDTNQVEAQVMHIASGGSPLQLLAIDNVGAAAVRFTEGQPVLSGFGSLKTTHERVLGVYESSLDTYEALFSTITAGGGALNYQAQTSSQVLSVDGVDGSRVNLRTNRYHYYNPGTSNLYKMTISCGDSGKAGNQRRWGAADDNDGLIFELDGTVLKTVIRSSVTGSVVNTKVQQSDWNKDKLDGTGPSGVVIDVTKVNVYWLDYQWLGAGRVRFGIYAPDGTRVVCHQFQNAGANTLPYMRSGTLPAMLENINSGTVGSSSELRNICIGVYSEGTYEDYAFWRFADIDRIGAVVTTDTPLASIRATPTVNSKHNTVIIYPETLNVYCDQPVAITLWQNTAVTAGTWESLASIAEVNYLGTVSNTGSQKFKTLYFGAGAHSLCIDSYFEKNDEGIQMNSDGTHEVWSVLATRLTNSTTTCSLNLGYKELW